MRNVTRVATAGFDTNCIDQDEPRQPGGIAYSDLGCRPATHRKAEQHNVPKVEGVQQIEIEVDEVLQGVEMLWDAASCKARMDRRNDVKPFCEPREKRQVTLWAIAPV